MSRVLHNVETLTDQELLHAKCPGMQTLTDVDDLESWAYQQEPRDKCSSNVIVVSNLAKVRTQRLVEPSSDFEA